MRSKIKYILVAIFMMVFTTNYLYATDPVLKWDASTGDVSGYTIYYGLSQGNYPFSEDVGNVTQYSLSDFPLSEGTTYYFVVRAYNATGESSDSNVTTYAVPSAGDTTPPLPPGSVSGEVGNENIVLTWQANTEIDISGYRVYYGTSSRNYGLPIPVNGTEYSITGLESDVTYYIAVSAVDTSGNESGYSSPETQETIFIADTTSPIVTITSPTSESTYGVETSQLNIAGTASDAEGITQVSWSNSGGGSGTASGTTNWAVSDIALGEGENLITVNARDNAGNTSISTLTVTYTAPDTTAPVVTVTSPTWGDNYETDTNIIDIGGNVSDAVGVTQVTWKSDKGESGIAVGTNTWSVTGISLVEGPNVIIITAEDEASNSSTDIITVTYTIPDTTAPEVTITSPTSETSYTTKSDSIDIDGTATDNIGTSSVIWSNSRGGSGNAIGTYSWNVSGIALAEGENIITITALDEAGNSSTDIITVTYTIPDTTASIISIYRPIFETTVSGTVISGTFDSTYTSDNIYEQIKEVISDNHPIKQTSMLEHKWSFMIDGGGSPVFYLEAYRSDNIDSDDFVFEYSTDNITYNNLVTVNSSNEQSYFVKLPDLPAGTIYVRVKDINRSWDNTSLDSIYIDEMYFEMDTTPTPPTADFTGDSLTGYAPHKVNFIDKSSGLPGTWVWDFGDGYTSNIKNPIHEYNIAGTYNVTLTVTNDYGQGVLTKTGYITVNKMTSTTVHVANITVTRKIAGRNQSGIAEITVVDQDGNPVAGSMVYGYFNESDGTLKNGITNEVGISVINGDNTKIDPGTFCFTITDVVFTNTTYDPGQNIVASDCEGL